MNIVNNMAARCHSGLEPESTSLKWIPACAGMTMLRRNDNAAQE